MPFYFYAWIGVLFVGLETVIAKWTSKYSISNPWLFNFVGTFFFLLLTLPVALLNGVGIPQYWDNLILASIFNSLVFVLNIFVIYKLDVSVSAPLSNISLVFSTLLGALFLGEILKGWQLFFIGLILIASIFASIDEKFSIKSFFTWAILLQIINKLSGVLMSVFLNKAISQNGYWNVSLWILVLTQIIMLVTIPLFIKDLKKITQKQLLAILAVCISGVIGTLAVYKAFSFNISITTAIFAIPSAMILAILYSLFSKHKLEKHTLQVYLVRVVATILIVLSAVILSK